MVFFSTLVVRFILIVFLINVAKKIYHKNYSFLEVKHNQWVKKARSNNPSISSEQLSSSGASKRPIFSKGTNAVLIQLLKMNMVS